jgi:hypothetical protein
MLSPASESDEGVVTGSRSRVLKVVGVVSAMLVLSAMLALAWHGSHGASLAGASIDQSVELTAGEVETGQPLWQINLKERDHCADTKDDCLAAGCCKTSGYHCLKTGTSTGKCSKYCPKGKSCTVVSGTMTFDVQEHTSMFCFSVFTQNTGSTKKSYEKELLEYQYKNKISIFACDASAVYGDVEVSLGDGLSTIKVEDVEGDFHFAKRKTQGTWVNTGVFTQVWKAMGKAGTYSNYDWTIKSDADAVFFPSKLVDRIHLLPVPPQGAFLQNCEGVDYGFFGNLEVFSKTAFSILIANIDTCKHKTVANWKVGIKNGKYGPMGEDLFAELCLRKNGVAELEAFDITKDGACEAKRPADQKKNKKWKADCSSTSTPAIHPFKKPTDWANCYEAAVSL